MGMLEDPFASTVAGAAAESLADDFTLLTGRAAHAASAPAPASAALSPVVARLHGFDLLEQPRLSQLPNLPGEIVAARSTVALRRAMVGSEVLVVFVGGDATQPVIVGVLQTPAIAAASAAPGVTVEADGDRHLISAEREIVLRCGDASITLTRAGKVIIKGHYILSRSSGYNRIKGAAIDIN